MEKEFEKRTGLIDKNLIFKLQIPEKNTKKVRSAFQELEDKINNHTKDRIIRRKARFVSIELIENVLRYGYFNGIYESFVRIAFFDKKYYFSSGNLVKNSEISYINQRLNKINSAYAEQNPKEILRAWYRNKLAQVGVTDNDIKIGILELARRLDDRILYHFNKINDEFSEFSIICTLNA